MSSIQFKNCQMLLTVLSVEKSYEHNHALNKRPTAPATDFQLSFMLKTESHVVQQQNLVRN